MLSILGRIDISEFDIRLVLLLLVTIISITVCRYFWLARKRDRKECDELIEKKELEKNIGIMKSRQEERSRISADLHDDLGAGLTSIRLYSELAKEKYPVDSPEIEKISSLSNELVNRMNAIIWTMDQANDSLQNTIMYLQKTANEYFEDTKIECKVNVDENYPIINISGERRRNIYLIMNEILANALKHAHATVVEISISCDSELKVQVKDNGVGFDHTKNSRPGNGLKNIRKRVESLGGTIHFDGTNGTKVEVSVPFS